MQRRRVEQMWWRETLLYSSLIVGDRVYIHEGRLFAHSEESRDAIEGRALGVIADCICGEMHLALERERMDRLWHMKRPISFVEAFGFISPHHRTRMSPAKVPL